MKKIYSSSDTFYTELKKITEKRSQYNMASVDNAVKSIIKRIKPKFLYAPIVKSCAIKELKIKYR